MSVDISALRTSARRRASMLIGLGCLLAGCMNEPPPRSYIEFMEDPVARDGTLARCNQDRAASANDVECINARRAASTVSVNAQAAQARQREAESEVQRAALRDRIAAQQNAARRAEEAAVAAAEAAYDRQWEDTVASAGQGAEIPVPPPGAAYGTPLNAPQPRTPSGASVARPEPTTSTADQVAYSEPTPSGGLSTWNAPEPPSPPQDSLSYVEPPSVPPPHTDSLEFIELPAGVTEREYVEPARKLEELTIPRPFRYPEPL